MVRSSVLRVTGTLALVAGMAAGPMAVSAASKPSAHHSAAPTWVSTKGKTVNLTLVAAYTNDNGGFNFNGASKGKLTVTVPLGDKVNVTFSNNASLPHSAQFVAFSKTPPTGSVSDAFKGANSANPTAGVAKG